MLAKVEGHVNFFSKLVIKYHVRAFVELLKLEQLTSIFLWEM